MSVVHPTAPLGISESDPLLTYLNTGEPSQWAAFGTPIACQNIVPVPFARVAGSEKVGVHGRPTCDLVAEISEPWLIGRAEIQVVHYNVSHSSGAASGSVGDGGGGGGVGVGAGDFDVSDSDSDDHPIILTRIITAETGYCKRRRVGEEKPTIMSILLSDFGTALELKSKMSPASAILRCDSLLAWNAFATLAGVGLDPRGDADMYRLDISRFIGCGCIVAHEGLQVVLRNVPEMPDGVGLQLVVNSARRCMGSTTPFFSPYSTVAALGTSDSGSACETFQIDLSGANLPVAALMVDTASAAALELETAAGKMVTIDLGVVLPGQCVDVAVLTATGEGKFVPARAMSAADRRREWFEDRSAVDLSRFAKKRLLLSSSFGASIPHTVYGLVHNIMIRKGCTNGSLHQ
jgi:hypothetical protein